MNKYRSTLNPVTIIVNIALYAVLLVLIYINTPKFFIVGCLVVFVCIVLSIIKFFSYKYFLEHQGLIIIHKRQKIIVAYKNIKYVEVDSKQTGMLYGYGNKRLLVGCGKGIEETYLITPEKEEEFIKNLEIKVKNAKKGTN